jgi:hypothetical protein
MMVEIDDDFLDTIVQQALVKDYVWLTNDLKKNKFIHPEDAEAYKAVSEAIKVLGGWYFAFGEFDKEVKKARKKLK